MINTIALPSFVLGYHGCDIKIAEDVLSGRVELKPSKNCYDWLGTGIYFWEHNPKRAFKWAAQKYGKTAAKPAVIGAIINLDRCLNLLDASALQLVKQTYDALAASARRENLPLPENRKIRGNEDILLRELDCMVINKLMEQNRDFSTVRAVFVEGERLYPGAGFREKNHIQICVRETSSIVGYFRVRL